MKALVAVVVVVAGCKSSAEKICEKAAARYEQCMVEVLGAGVSGMVHDNLGVGAAACAKSDKTVAMYRECLDKTSCSDFDQCMDSYAERTAPKVDPALPRDKQCAQHVKIRQQALAFEIMIDENPPDNADTRKVAMCLSADDADAAKCLSDHDAAELVKKSAALEQECLGWSAEVAACKLKLPGAKCKDDESGEPAPPPPALGAAGPAIAWQLALVKDDDAFGERPFGWTADHALVIATGKHLRALHDGKELWSVPTKVDMASHVAFLGARILVGDEDGLHVLAGATGEEVETPVHGFVFSVAAAGDHAIVRQDRQLYDLACKAKCTATKLATIDEDLMPSFAAMTNDGLVVGSSDEQLLLDRRGKPRVTLTLDTDKLNHAEVTAEGIAIDTEDLVAVVALAACSKHGAKLTAPDLDAIPGCVVASGKPGGHPMVALSGGGVAYDDGQDQGHTHVLTKAKQWATLTYGTGAIAADADTIYTLSRMSYDAPVELIALARDTGAPRWHSPLPKAKDLLSVQIAARDGFVAVRVDDQLFVFQNHP